MDESVCNTMAPPEKPQPETQEMISRRRLLMILAASGGAVAAATLLPGQWTTPVLGQGTVPPSHCDPTPTTSLALVHIEIQGGPALHFSVTLGYSDKLGQVSDATHIRAYLDTCGDLFSGTIGSLGGPPYNVTRSGTPSEGHIQFVFDTTPACMATHPDLCVELTIGSRHSNLLCCWVP